MSNSIVVSSEQVHDAVGSIRDEMLQFLSLYVSKATVQGNFDEERAALALLEQQFDEMHVHCERVAIGESDAFAPVSWSYENRFNLIATLAKSDAVSVHDKEVKSIAFNGHIDVVPIESGAAQLWTSDPFTMDVRDGNIFGRGVGDMKAGLVSAMFALRALEVMGYRPRGAVQYHAVVEEECTGNGATSLMASDKTMRTDAVVIPEPLPGLLYAQLGVMWIRVRVTGKSVHVLDTGAGANAIEKAMALFGELKRLEAAWNGDGALRPAAYAKHAHPINFNLGRIDGGVWASSVPCECAIQVRLGFFPDTQSPAQVRGAVERHLAEAGERLGIAYALEYEGFQSEGFVNDALIDSPLAKCLLSAHASSGGAAPPAYTAATCTTDARAYVATTPQTTCYGPEATSIHGVDEHVRVDELLRCTRAFVHLIAQWCQLEEVKRN
jgi:acetylornithine deacetylase